MKRQQLYWAPVLVSLDTLSQWLLICLSPSADVATRTIGDFILYACHGVLSVSSPVLQVSPLVFHRFTLRSSKGLMGKYRCIYTTAWLEITLHFTVMISTRCGSVSTRVDDYFLLINVSQTRPTFPSVDSYSCVCLLSAQWRQKLPGWLNVIYLSLVRQARSQLS